MIKVVMITRATLYTASGGDTIQVLETARNLRKQGIAVDIKLTDEQIDYGNYDLIHFFNVTRPADIYHHIRKTRKPFLLSPILTDYSEYDKYHRKGISGMLFRFLSADGIEYVKTISRWLFGKDKLISSSFVWKGQRKTVINVLKRASLLLPNSHSEYERLVKQYGDHAKYMVVPNGVDPSLFQFNAELEKDPKLVLCVARIEGIKNQINLIRALNNSNYNLLIIGSAAPNQLAYFHKCKKNAAANISFIENLPQQELVRYYQKAKVHVLASWFETTGLSSLEAAVMGCNIVVTGKGDTKEYFGDNAFYCEPGSPESIYAAIERAASSQNDQSLRSKILSHYTWQQATVKTIEAYEEVLKRR